MESEYVQGTLVPKDLLEPLGLLIVHFSLVEQSVDDTLVLFLDLDKTRGEFVAAQFSSLRIKTEMLRFLAEKSLPDQLDRDYFGSVMKKVSEANDARNLIIHGDWHYLGILFDVSVAKNTLTRGGKPKTTPISEVGIRDAARKAFEAYIALEAAVKVVKRIPPTDLPLPWLQDFL